MELEIRKVRFEEYRELGELMVDIYSSLDGFPCPEEQPKYYEMLANIGKLNEQSNTEVLAAVLPGDAIIGAVVYFSDMAQYGSGGEATHVKNASGIRLLGVDHKHRNKGAGKALTFACIDRARTNGHRQVILHTTDSMKVAWQLYERLGFERSTDLDFMQGKLQVFGFRLQLVY